jgi:hypothetical protein
MRMHENLRTLKNYLTDRRKTYNDSLHLLPWQRQCHGECQNMSQLT